MNHAEMFKLRPGDKLLITDGYSAGPMLDGWPFFKTGNIVVCNGIDYSTNQIYVEGMKHSVGAHRLALLKYKVGDSFFDDDGRYLIIKEVKSDQEIVCELELYVTEGFKVPYITSVDELSKEWSKLEGK